MSVSQFSCECMFGMSPIGGNPESGCQLTSACSADTCDPTAVCQTELDGQPRSDTQPLCLLLSRTWADTWAGKGLEPDQIWFELGSKSPLLLLVNTKCILGYLATPSQHKSALKISSPSRTRATSRTMSKEPNESEVYTEQIPFFFYPSLLPSRTMTNPGLEPGLKDK